MDEFIGLWGSDENGHPHIELHADGSATGSDGANGIHTTYAVDGRTARLAPRASTLRAVIGVDDWLRAARTLELDGDTLTVRNAKGAVIGTLTRETPPDPPHSV